MGAGMMPPLAADQIDHKTQPPQPPTPGVTAEYGKLLGGLCIECHGADLTGMPFGPPGQEVMTPNLTAAGELGSWSEAGFLTTMRTGVTPIQRRLNDEMPWKYFGQMTDDELKALWLYLRSLPGQPQAKS
jgi:mono/diheme cytochrome c family protein